MTTDPSASWSLRFAGYLGFGAMLLWLNLFGAALDRLTLAAWDVTGLLWVVVGLWSLAGAVLAAKGLGARIEHRAVLDAGCAAVLAGCPLLLWVIGSPAGCVASLALAGPCATWLLLRWGAMLAKLKGPDALRAIAANAACYFVAKALVGALVGEGADVMGPLTVVLAPISGVALYAVAGIPGSQGHAFYTAENARSLIGIFAFMALFSVVLVLLDVLTWNASRGILAYLVAALVFMAVAGWVFGLRRQLDFYTDVRTLLVATACGAALCVAASGALQESAAGLVLGIRELTRFYLFLLQADIARHSCASSGVVFGLGWACCGIPRLPLCWVNERSAEGLVFGDGGYRCLTLTVLLLLLVVIMGYSLIKMPPGLRPPFSLAPLPVASGGEPGMVPGDVLAACDALAQTHDLTAREAQILGYLCAGRSRGYIADTLYISENTVKFHTKNVYRKLGVTSKQELIDLCQRG